MNRSFRLRKITLSLGISALLLLFVGLFAFQNPFRAQAHTAGHFLFVGHTAGSNSGCASPGYTSVQAAVDAAHTGNTVYLCASFAEQVIIANKQITLTGERGAALDAPNPFPTAAFASLPPQFATDNLFIPEAIVIIWGPHANVTVSRLTIDGVMPTNNSCANLEYGVLVLDGATATLDNDRVNDIRDSRADLYGCQFGSAIQIGRSHWPNASYSSTLVENFTGHATITNTSVAGYQKNGIVVDGPGSTANIGWNRVNGSNRDTLLSPIIAQNGIEVLYRAWASVHHNTVVGNTYTGPAYASASGILVYGGCGSPLVKNVEIADNTLINNDVGISLNDYSSDCSAPSPTRTNDEAENNTIRDNAVTNVGDGTSSGFPYKGYQAGVEDIGNYDVIAGNTISGAGYVPSQTTHGGPFVMAIDTTSFPTIHPIIHNNDIDG